MNFLQAKKKIKAFLVNIEIFKLFGILLMLCLIIMTLFLSWTYDSIFIHMDFIPKRISIWADQYPRFRTSIPFFFISIIVGFLEQKFFKYLILNCSLVVFVELIQLFIPTRHCDIYDILWGCFGVVSGLL